jgi:hypothetical protein
VRDVFFDVLSGRVGLPYFLSLVNVIVLRYRTRAGNFLQIDFHRTNYGIHEPLNDAIRHFNEFAGLFDTYIHTLKMCDALRCCSYVTDLFLLGKTTNCR